MLATAPVYSPLVILLSAVLIVSPAEAADARSTGLPACDRASTLASTKISLTAPPTGRETEVDVGGSVISTTEGEVATSALVLADDANFTGKRAGAVFLVKVPAGRLASQDFGQGLYPAVDATFRYEREKGERRGFSKPEIFVFVDPENDTKLKARIETGLGHKDADAVPDAKFERTRCLRIGPRGFRREILYSGGAKGAITLQYREFAGDIARPAFSQELSYDLAQGNEIGFKGARIRVLKISNTGMRYVVIKPLD